MKKTLLIIASFVLIASCVSKKKLAEAQADYSTFKASAENNLNKVRSELRDCDKSKSGLESDLKSKTNELDLKAQTVEVK